MTAVGPHFFKKLCWWAPSRCAHCYLPRAEHRGDYYGGWTAARPLGDKRPAPDLERQS